MRSTVVVFVVLLAAMPMAQVPLSESPDVTRVRDELRALFAELHTAVMQRERAALERLFAAEYAFLGLCG
jgi:hypothetical protein